MVILSQQEFKQLKPNSDLHICIISNQHMNPNITNDSKNAHKSITIHIQKDPNTYDQHDGHMLQDPTCLPKILRYTTPVMLL